MAEPVHRTEHPSGPDPVRTLRTLFAEVLGRAEVDAGHSFTGLGGDSIQAIQVVSRARAAGLVVSTRDVLRAESVNALAATARAQGRAGEDAGPAVPPRRLGPLAPTPIMGWLAELGGPVDTYNQSLVLRTPPGFGAAAAERTVQALLDTHEMLRLRLPEGIGAAGAEPVVPPAGSVTAAELLELVDARGTGEAELPALTRERMRAARRLLSPREGHMLRAVLLDRGAGQQGRLALVVHHLVVDGVSWRILQDDLRSCWTALAEGREPALEPAATPFAHWADLLRAEATSGRRTTEADRWAAALREAPQPLAGVRAPGGLDPESPENTLTLTLGPDVTGPLLTTAPGLVNGTVNDVLLTALALAVLGRRDADEADEEGEEGAVLVDVEGHGREDVADGTDLSRTVGWFTTVFPVRLALGRPDLDEARAGGPAVGAALRLVKEELRAVPDKGIGFGLLRHLNSRTGPDLAARGIPEIGFNYLGRFPMGGDAPWDAAPGHDFALDDADEGLPMAHAVEVNAAAHEGPDGLTLSATWTWAGNVFPRQWVHDLAQEWFTMLRAVVTHAARPDAGGLTPSDVSLAQVSQADLDTFESQLGALL
ncbi:condensation domain-containing protein [Streptomyces virginiae]|uniref:Condensation domain-containing protein n=1 Tax=Streptomyces virginiae TaxID=1961 RepID=A0ABZ1T7X8_STRVG|nr:condensation domain-containing protein [Streptomyces virginiae]WTB21255.1 condensation domain-containing protein [Streptomyces virginiae]